MQKFGSDYIAELIATLDIPFVALNPGASFRGLHDSFVHHETMKMPELIECTHEEISVAVAHGYAKATGKIMAAALHNTVGLQHATMAIFNAWCDRVPVMLLGGSGPVNVEKRRPWIDWIHTALVQGNQIRDYVKFDDQPASIQSVSDSLYRAYRLALTQPAGPVYVCFDVALQEDPIPEELLAKDPTLITPPNPALYKPGAAPAPHPEVLEVIAKAIINADFPVIITDHSGRTAEGFYSLTELAEQWALPVIDLGGRLNLPSNSPMNVTEAHKDVIQKADVVIALDLRDLYGAVSKYDAKTHTAVSLVKEGTRVFSVGLQDYGVRSWSTDYQKLCPAEQTVLADSQVFLKELQTKLSIWGEGKADLADNINKRYQQVKEWHEQLRLGSIEFAQKQKDLSPIALSSFALEMWEFLKNKEFVLANGNLRGWTNRIFEMNHPYQYLGPSGGAGLGYGIGATIGTALAHRETGKLVVDIQSDGDLMYTPGGLWTLAHHKLPALIVMNNNRTYFNSEEHQTSIARSRGRNENLAGIGTHLADPYIDFVQMAKSMGVEAIGPIEKIQDLRPALEQAWHIIVQEKRPVLIDVLTQKI